MNHDWRVFDVGGHRSLVGVFKRNASSSWYLTPITERYAFLGKALMAVHVTDSLVAAWAPYFDDMNAIIFLAPISCFDQVLQEDPSVNRLVCRFPACIIPQYLIRASDRLTHSCYGSPSYPIRS